MPKARAKWLAGSVEHDPAEATAAAFGQAQARDPARRTWVVLVEGACHQYDLIRAEAARRDATISIVIDLIHVLEYLWKAAWSLHAAADPAAEDWVAVKALAILAGDSARMATNITAKAQAAGLTAGQRNGADACVRYLTSKHELLRYDLALAAGWPIATGVIEGACRHLIGDRLDITGARWGLEGAEAILTLRAVISNGDFDDYCRYYTSPASISGSTPRPHKANTRAGPDPPCRRERWAGGVLEVTVASGQAQQRPGQNCRPLAAVPEVVCASASVMCPSGSTYPARQSSRRETRQWNARSWWPSTAAPAWTT